MEKKNIKTGIALNNIYKIRMIHEKLDWVSYCTMCIKIEFPCLKHPDKKLQSVLQDSMWQCFKMDFLVSNTLTRSYSLSSTTACDSVSKWISLSQTPWQEATVCPPRQYVSVSKWISLSQTPWQEATVCPPQQYVTVFQNGFPCLKHLTRS